VSKAKRTLRSSARGRTSTAIGTALVVSLLSQGCATKRPKDRPATEHQTSAPGQLTLTHSAPRNAELPGVLRVNVPVSAAAPRKGVDDAPLTLVVFSDFECPFCARAEPTLRELEQTYGARLRVVWRNLPLDLHSHARLAAEAALEAHAQGGDVMFWAMHDKLMANQKALEPKDLERYARELGLDARRFHKALELHSHAAAVETDLALARRVGASAAPVFFLNGRPLQGALPVTVFRALLDDELTRVEQLHKSGVAAADVYGALIASGQERVNLETKPARPSLFEPTVYNVPVSSADPQRGSLDALVTVVVFGDFECEFTQQALAALAPLEKKYGKDVRLVWKNQPMKLHERARDAATLAMLAFDKGGSELFWQASVLLFANRTALGREALVGYGEQLGLAATEARAALAEERYKAKVDADKQLSARVDFSPTTPMITVNGRYVRGAQSERVYQLLIDEELSKASARVASGVDRARIYEELIKDGKLEPFEIAPGTASADARKLHELPLPAKFASKGDPTARVVIQEFGDFECPFCEKVQPVLQQLLARHPDTLRLVWRNDPLPVHPHGRLAAEAAQEALEQGGSDKFWAYHDLLFKNQGALTRTDLERYAEKLGLNLAKFRAALDTGRHRAALNADLAAVDSLGEQVGTPAFLVNGMLIAGSQPLEIFETAYRRALLRQAASANTTNQ
jgi:protein-disulfide isomerase